MAASDGHWLLYGYDIVVRLNDGTLSVIAKVENMRACRQMLRYAQAGEDVEALVDQLVGEAHSNPAVCPEVPDHPTPKAKKKGAKRVKTSLQKH